MNYKFKIRPSREKYIAFCQALCIFNVLIDYLVSLLFRIIGIPSDNLRVITYIIYIFLAISALLIRGKFRVRSLLLPVFLVIALIVSMNVNPDIDKYSNFYESMLFICLPVYILYKSYFNIELVTKYAIFISYFSCVFFGLVFFIHFLVTPILKSANYQTTSYALLLPFIILAQKKGKKPIDFILLSWVGILSVLAGGRISIFCLGLYFAVLIIKRGSKNILYGIVMIIPTLVILWNFDSILELIAKLCNSLGIKGGIAYYSGIGNVYLDSTRTVIYDECLTLIAQKPFIGYGLLGDRLVLNYAYSHNVFLEVAMQFGIIISALLALWIIYKIIRVLLSERKNGTDLILFRGLFYTTGFVVLLFSNSYLNQPCFFAFLAMLSISDQYNSNTIIWGRKKFKWMN